ncbi:hypothetical protein [Catellatospora chokoriensis]|uniref:Uncharacterized protein n=1 Tax=Catellatospora chokoriensis TaxID=310353 RepID=A0A8J3K3C9_9ACTN|nr:hypothetical protein [Catellatospora chokoriensis]GIF91717.1 hypothetical protein Cch02nite_51610 [Catellatospora chokoriensis]
MTVHIAGHDPDAPPVYCRRWNFRRHEPVEPLTADEAQARDAAGEPYTVVPAAPRSGVPDVVIEIAWENGHAGVWFFDAYGRQCLHYSFRRSGEQLFLGGMTTWEYPDAGAATLSGATCVSWFEFREDGGARRVISDDTAQQRTVEDRTGVDVSTQWEPVPGFGKWDSLARWSRS